MTITKLLAYGNNAEHNYSLGVQYATGQGLPEYHNEAARHFILAYEEGFSPEIATPLTHQPTRGIFGHVDNPKTGLDVILGYNNRCDETGRLKKLDELNNNQYWEFAEYLAEERPVNPPPLTLGTEVVCVGLKSEMGSKLNGRKGVTQAIDQPEEKRDERKGYSYVLRIGVLLHGESKVKSFKTENLTLELVNNKRNREDGVEIKKEERNYMEMS